MNLILLFPGDFAPDGTARLAGRRARHVHEVHRAAVGDRLVVGKLNGPVGEATVLAVASDEVRLGVRFDGTPPPSAGIDLLLAMPRPKVLRRVLQSAASLGARRIALVNASRVEKSYFDTPFLEPSEVERNLVLGLEQARDTVLPEVFVRRRFRPFVEDELEALWPRDSCARLVAHPVAERGAAEVGVEGGRARVVLAVGPEGGWIPYELDLLEANGFVRFGLGPRVLRVETAIPFAFGQLLGARADRQDVSGPAAISPSPEALPRWRRRGPGPE